MTRLDEGSWRLPVTERVVAGSSALFGGCGTAAAIVAAADLTDHRPRWLATHFFGLARGGGEVALATTTVTAGRTIAHISVAAEAEGRPCFETRLAFGERPALADDVFIDPPAVPPPDASDSFDLPSHSGTFADRFEWRLCSSPGRATAVWWVRPSEPGLGRDAAGALLCDYVTYGIGRAAGVLVGGLSIDNVVRFHSAPRPADEWLLLEISAESLDGGFGSGAARVWSEDGTLVATGSQTVVLNEWDWRTPTEREQPS